MSILEFKNVTEHKCCPNFAKIDIDRPILLNNLTKSESMSSNLKHCVSVNKLLYVIEGELNIIAENKSYTLYRNQLLLLPCNYNTVITGSKSNNDFIMLSIGSLEHLCHNYSLDILYKELKHQEDQSERLFSIEANEILVKFFDFVQQICNDGIYCRHYAETKVVELLFLLRAYYQKKDLFNFFLPILSSDLAFSQFIMSNHTKAKTVTDLANLANYSLSGFQKRFKKIFGISAHSWMRKEKLKFIYDDISHSSMTLKDLSMKHDFSTPSHFNDYCKANLGFTPGYIRKKKIKIHVDSYINDK